MFCTNGFSLRSALLGVLMMASVLVEAVPNGNLHRLAKAAGKLYFGTAVDNPDIDRGSYRPIMANTADFGQVTVGNTQKWQYVEPSQGKFDFSKGDAVVGFAQANKQLLRCHTLVWYNQLPDWVKATKWSRPQLESVIRSHVKNVVQHYAGKCYAWDVVNEALDDSANANFRDSVFQQVLGTAWIPLAFKAAAEADPQAKLYYNDYSIEQPGKKHEQSLRIVDLIKASGARIDGVGLQGHFVVGQTGSKERLVSVLKAYVAKGVDVAYTEIDIRHSRLPADATALQRQADDYAAVVGACLAVPRCVGITVWGASDAHSWIPSVFPGHGDATLMDHNMNPKPAYNRVRDVLAAAGRGRKRCSRAVA